MRPLLRSPGRPLPSPDLSTHQPVDPPTLQEGPLRQTPDWVENTSWSFRTAQEDETLERKYWRNKSK